MPFVRKFSNETHFFQDVYARMSNTKRINFKYPKWPHRRLVEQLWQMTSVMEGCVVL